mmetsp:Transcript_73333/g.202367  ORF Transcript_73333/g.202367 Transcript_73333/m.202367 type:complete len:225 (-) Transcript_73333:181-855(-)
MHAPGRRPHHRRSRRRRSSRQRRPSTGDSWWPQRLQRGPLRGRRMRSMPRWLSPAGLTGCPTSRMTRIPGAASRTTSPEAPVRPSSARLQRVWPPRRHLPAHRPAPRRHSGAAVASAPTPPAATATALLPPRLPPLLPRRTAAVAERTAPPRALQAPAPRPPLRRSGAAPRSTWPAGAARRGTGTRTGRRSGQRRRGWQRRPKRTRLLLPARWIPPPARRRPLQ